MSSNKMFHFIAVNFNNSKFTISYIESVVSLNNYKCNIVIIDNSSQKNDIQELEFFCEKHSNVVLIKNEINIGYFPALNKGLDYIERHNDDYVIIGNNDLSFQYDFLLKLDSISLPKNVYVIAPNIITLDNIHQNPHIISNFNLIKKVYRRIYYSNFQISIFLQFIYSKIKYLNGSSDRKYHDKIMPILMGYGACYILTPYFFKHYTNLDAPVFLMGEEGILANQILRTGGIIVYHPELIVNHFDHSSIGKLPNKVLYRYSQISYQHYLKNCTYISK